MVEPIKTRLKNELTETFKAINTCLGCYYHGDTHMYRPLAGQLRILFCDTNFGKDHALLERVYNNFSVSPLKKTYWIRLRDSKKDSEVRKFYRLTNETEMRVGYMPFVIIQYTNGLEVADLKFADAKKTMLLNEWCDQSVTVYPINISIRQIIRSVADKGGGSHVDDNENPELQLLRVFSPTQIGAEALFIVALGRFAQKLGLYHDEISRSGFNGDLEDFIKIWSPDEKDISSLCKEPECLIKGKKDTLRLMVVKAAAEKSK